MGTATSLLSMTPEQADLLTAEVWNIKMEIVRLMDRQSEESQQMLELLNGFSETGTMLGMILGFMTGVMFAILVVKGFDR